MKIILRCIIVMLMMIASVTAASSKSLTIEKPQVEFVKIDSSVDISYSCEFDFTPIRGSPTSTLTAESKQISFYGRHYVFWINPKANNTITVLIREEYKKVAGIEVICYVKTETNINITSNVKAKNINNAVVRIRGQDC